MLKKGKLWNEFLFLKLWYEERASVLVQCEMAKISLKNLLSFWIEEPRDRAEEWLLESEELILEGKELKKRSTKFHA